ncbi:MAG: hypothetical protein CL678_06605 [Bdellovibrionaceae bacterium]|nr:hypothetical protein [Pseudobdellovibrionaceae bacterium]|tara:strand:- start:1113 stop:2327 length:1215 start_codon:yes stop_codon:yes gene_type:complete
MTIYSSHRSAEQAAIQESNKKVRRAEKEAQKKINATQKRVNNAQKESRFQLEEIRDSFEKSERLQKDKYTKELELLRNEQNQNLRELKSDHQIDLSRSKNQNENELRKINQYYENQQRRALREGENKFNRQIQENHIQHQALQNKNRTELLHLKNQGNSQIDSKRWQFQNQIENLDKNGKKEIKLLTEKVNTEKQKSSENFKNRYQEMVKVQDEILNNLNKRISEEVHQIKKDSVMKLGAFMDQKSDPFYRTMTLDADFSESDDEYQIRARIPEHERDGIKINVHDNEIFISGERKSSETIHTDEGGTVSSSQFQTYHQSFPIHSPVESHLLRKEYDGDELVISLPKKGSELAKNPIKKIVPEEVTAKRPYFPENIPLGSQKPSEDDVELVFEPSDQSGRTLDL